VTLSSSSATMAFYSDAACASQIASASIAAGASSTAAFYFRDINVGTVTLTASAAAIAPAAQVENLRPCTAVQTPWQTSGTGTLTVDYGCSGSATASNPCASTTNVRYYYGQMDIKFAADAPTALAFTSAPQTVTAGSCSAVVSVDSRGCNNSVARVSAFTTVS